VTVALLFPCNGAKAIPLNVPEQKIDELKNAISINL
jgi:hypothetical protein